MGSMRALALLLVLSIVMTTEALSSASVVQRLALKKAPMAGFNPSLRLGPGFQGRERAICGDRSTCMSYRMQLGDKKASGGGKAAVLDKPIIETAPSEADKKQPGKPYHVLLFNDVLRAVFGHSKSQAYDIMNKAHTTGFAICNTTDKEEADAQSAELGNNNLMSSVIEAD